MDKAFDFLKLIFLLTAIIYFIGLFSVDRFLEDFVSKTAPKLAPYGIEILHLR